jgi:ribosome modulation factor
MNADDAYEEGYDAYWEGVDLNDDPYDEETEDALWESWGAGWRAAQHDDHDENERRRSHRPR